MLTGVYKPTAGASSSTARTSPGKPPHAITERGIGRTFQNIRLFQNMTALENVLVGMHCAAEGGSSTSILRTPRRAGARRRGARSGRASCSSYVGLGAQARRVRAQPAYGDQRRLEVARALATEPKLLLLDEPTAGMNPQETADVHRLRRASCATSAG